MDFKNQYQIYLDKVNEEIEKIYSVPDLPQKSVFEAMEYGVAGGGKRIRPVLAMAVCDMLGGNLNDAARVGCAIESIHSYSLIHDDLPCMDDDDLRRGKPSCHKAYGEDIALLAGDGLLNSAFEILSDADAYESMGAKEILSVIKEISTASGALGMIGGQVIDLESEERDDVSLEELCGLHRRKTGALIRVSAVCGCLCAGISDQKNKDFQKIIEFSEKIGLAFQIKDDILDVIGQEELLGKPIGSDAEQNKNTFVTLMGLEGATEELNRLTKEAKQAVSGFDKNEFLLEFADYLLNRNN